MTERNRESSGTPSGEEIIIAGIIGKPLNEALIWLRQQSGLTQREIAKEATALRARQDIPRYEAAGLKPPKNIGRVTPSQIMSYEGGVVPREGILECLLSGVFGLALDGRAVAHLKVLRQRIVSDQHKEPWESGRQRGRRKV